jgi:hypothetical protein
MQQQKSEQGTMDWCGSVQHGCQVIQTLPAPQQGRVKTSDGNFIQNQGFAQMAKHVAPHVSIDLPEGMDHDLEDGHHHQFLKGELEQLDASIGAPPFFAYEFVELPPQLHQTAFARELHCQVHNESERSSMCGGDAMWPAAWGRLQRGIGWEVCRA